MRGNPQPTSAEIADHAGVSVRMIFYHFGELEVLFLHAVDSSVPCAIDRSSPSSRRTARSEARVRATCHQRRQLFEAIGAGAQDGLLQSARLALRLRGARRDAGTAASAVRGDAPSRDLDSADPPARCSSRRWSWPPAGRAGRRSDRTPATRPTHPRASWSRPSSDLLR